MKDDDLIVTQEDYFRNDLFTKIAKIAVSDRIRLYSFMRVVTKKMNDMESRFREDPNEENESRLKNWVDVLFQVLVDEINGSDVEYIFWKQLFPPNWKITENNNDSIVSFLFFRRFREWLMLEVGQQSFSPEPIRDVTLANGLFPKAHHIFFPMFLRLYLFDDPEEAVKAEVRIHFSNMQLSYAGEKSDSEVERMWGDLDREHLRDTYFIIVRYFYDWGPLQVYKEDFTESEFKELNNKSNEDRKYEIISKISTKIRNVCRQFEVHKSEIDEDQKFSARSDAIISFLSSFSSYIEKPEGRELFS